jgi:transposase InsO family protein
LGKQGRREYLRAIHERYRKAERKDKGAILNEFCANTGYHRKHAIRLLNGPPPERRPAPPHRRRRLTYSQEMLSVLTAVWEAAGYPWSLRLRALLPDWLPWIRKRFRLRPETERQLLRISARQIDRRLKMQKTQRRRRLYGRTKPGYLLKHNIPIKTDSWDVDRPGFAEVDLVSHSGNSADGEFAHTLNLTDIHTTWTESRAVLGKGQARVKAALDQVQSDLPFRLLGLDSDNGSEFINWHLQGWCEQRQIQLTRGRPYKKDDNAHIEQKNWTHVRKLLGWERYDSPEAVEAINDLYRNELRLWLNLFLPSVKLAKKVRVGSKVRRRYDGPRTPFERVRACPQADPEQVEWLQELRKRLDPFELGKRIERKLERIYRLANRRRSPRASEQTAVGGQQAKRRGNGCGKAATWKSHKNDFSTPLGNLAQGARFPLSHSRGDHPSPVTFSTARQPHPR